MVMRPAGLSHVLNGEQRGLAENLLVKWRCTERAGRGWAHLDVGAFLSRSCWSELQAARTGVGHLVWTVLQRTALPTDWRWSDETHLCFHRSFPFKDAPGTRGSGYLEISTRSSLYRLCKGQTRPCSHSQPRRKAEPVQRHRGNLVTLCLNDYFHL